MGGCSSKLTRHVVCFSDVNNPNDDTGYFLEVSNGKRMVVLGRGQCCSVRVSQELKFALLVQRGDSANPTRESEDTDLAGQIIYHSIQFQQDLPQKWSTFQQGSDLSIDACISVMKGDSDTSLLEEYDFGLGPMMSFNDGTEHFMYVGVVEYPQEVNGNCCS